MKYLIRLDDITPGTNWKHFEKIEKIFDKYSIKPIIGVVPDNKDLSIIDNQQLINNDLFFDKIRKLQDKDYKVAMHGVNHILEETKLKSIVNINNFGELVNLNLNEKYKKLSFGKNILEKQDIAVDIYMPPAHWIDNDNVEALKKLSFLYVTDGIFPYPKNISGIWFIPQQLWRPRKMLIPGLYTICLHINSMENAEIDNVIKFIKSSKDQFIRFESIDLFKYERVYYKVYNETIALVFEVLRYFKNLFSI